MVNLIFYLFFLSHRGVTVTAYWLGLKDDIVIVVFLSFTVGVKDFQVFELKFGFSTPKSPRLQTLRQIGWNQRAFLRIKVCKRVFFFSSDQGSAHSDAKCLSVACVCVCVVCVCACVCVCVRVCVCLCEPSWVSFVLLWFVDCSSWLYVYQYSTP